MCVKCLANFSRKSYCKSHLKQVHGEENSNLIIDTNEIGDMESVDYQYDQIVTSINS